MIPLYLGREIAGLYTLTIQCESSNDLIASSKSLGLGLDAVTSTLRPNSRERHSVVVGPMDAICADLRERCESDSDGRSKCSERNGVVKIADDGAKYTIHQCDWDGSLTEIRRVHGFIG